MKAYTDREQSMKLAKILPIDTADGFYEAQFNPTTDKCEYILFTGNEWASEEVVIPCWSLVALLEILDFPELSKDRLGEGKVGWMVSIFPNNCRYDSKWHDNPIDACYEMIIKLHEEKLI